MTTTKAVREEIARFLENTTPDVLCLTGKWGVGKTFTWSKDLIAAQVAGNLGVERYAYVSLFGLNSLDDLKYAIFESTVPCDQIAKGPDHNSLKASAHWLEQKGRQFSYLLNAVPYAKDLLNGSKSAFLAVRDQLICIDDLERHGDGLALKDVLGLVSLLKEQRGCKIVLLLNKEELPEQSRADFETQLEKVIDTRIAFDPTPLEAVEIGLAKDTAVENLLKTFCPMLGIKNIRIITKIERTALKLAGLLADYDPAILRQAVQTATLFGWVHYQPNEAPSYEFVRGHNSLAFMMRKEKEASDQEKAWSALLSTYDFSMADEFDGVIADGITAGHFDVIALEREADALAKKIEHQEKDSSFHEAWELYHNSFLANADDVLDQMAEAFKKSVEIISPVNLSGTITLFKDLGRTEQAGELLAYYMATRKEEADFYDLSDHPFGGDISDPDVQSAFAEKRASYVDDRDPKQILIDIVLRSGWNPKDLQRIQKLSVADFKKLFTTNEGTDLRRMIQAALQFKSIGGIDKETVAMSVRAEEALIEIGAESDINARRVRKYGIVVPEKPEPAAPEA